MDVHDVGGRLEQAPHAPRRLLPGLRRRAVDLRHHRVHHGWPGRDLHHLHGRPASLRDRGEGGPHALGDVVALRVAVVLGGEVDLQVRQVRGPPQEVVADEAVEVEGGGVAGVELDVPDLGDRGQVVLHAPRRFEGDLEGRPLGVIEDHLELALVVEGQHLDLDQLDADEGDRAREEREHEGEERPARGGPRDERSHDAAVDAGGTPLASLDRCRRRVVAADARRRPRGDHERHGQGEQHGRGGPDGDGAHVGPRHAAHEGHGQDGGDHGEGGEDGGVSHLVDRLDGDAEEGLPLLLPVVALDVVDDHDRVVHEYADGEDEGEESDAVQGVAGDVEDEDGQGEGHRHRDADHQAAPPAHRQRDEDDDGKGGDEEVFDELVRLLLGRLAVVPGHVHADLRRQQVLPQVLDLAQDFPGEDGRVRPPALREGDRDRRVLAAGGSALAGGPGGEEDGVRRFVRAVDDPGDLGDVDRPPVGEAGHHPADLLRAAEEGTHLDPDLPVVAHGRARGLADGGGLQGARELRPADPGRAHAVGVRLHAHDPRLAADELGPARLGHLRELLGQLGRERSQAVARPALAPQGEGQEGHVVDRVQLDDRGQDVPRQDPAHRRLPLVDLDEARLVRLVDLEADGDHPQPGAGHGVDVLDAGDAPQDPLHGGDDPALDLGRLGARPRHHDVHHRHADLRLLLAGSGEEGERPEAEGGRDDERGELAVEEERGRPCPRSRRACYSACSSHGGAVGRARPGRGRPARPPRRRPGSRRCRRHGRRRPPSGVGPGHRPRRRGR